ncbi:putative mannose-1-phosphate guanylyltransferase [Tilletiaria anomala UBC 951]|uniref:Putative mannose-1-phosphate guanylyltransferase n=1 Tax=Tilletiaria anomala (strain ATCC 24038 / CBS 436.72 / UBC 951) TaxID=1037660 RepID=A0A066VQ19_TILAU|nr:putative mannose-1-phosphate guanylyltransferase [Tilletiaria anomala UBC 951]KDN40695.1 putative mannose-1-phosphate guanylyltransferase [Tilletiaria anomala UBC 951]
MAYLEPTGGQSQLSNGSNPAHGQADSDILAQILAGVSNMQREISRLHQRMDQLEEGGSAAGANSPFFGPQILAGGMAPIPYPGHIRSQSFVTRRQSNSFVLAGSQARDMSPEKHQQQHAAGGASSSASAAAAAGGLETSNLMAPHLSLSSGALSQPDPILTKEPSLPLWCVVPAGGAGTRLWPLSRESYPKFLLDLTGSGRTLLQATWDRLLPLAGAHRLMIVTGAAHSPAVAQQLPSLSPSNLLTEPLPKDSMAAIGLAAAVLYHRDPEAVLGSFAADHIISGHEAFEAAVIEAVAVAQAGYVVTIGIAPSHPSTGFGYIKLGEKLNVDEAPNARVVADFKEKPDAKTAAAYLQTGNYRWNGGMFVVKAKVLLELLAMTKQKLHDGLMRLGAVWDKNEEERSAAVREVWEGLEKIAIDHAVAEPAAKLGRVAVVPATFGWDDVGDFSSLADLIAAEKGEARVLGDARLVVTESQAGGLIVPAAGRPVACLGVDDVVVVDTPDALLITTRARSQDVKKIVSRFKKRYPTLC